MVIGLLVIVLVLVGMQTFAAVMHDRAVTAAGPTRVLDDLVAEIARKRADKIDLETDLSERRKALANIADAQGDYEALVRQIADLNVEWAQMEERRQEVRAVRSEMEEALIGKLNADADLASVRADYEAIKDRMIAAEKMFTQIEEMTREYAALEAKVGGLREEASRLADAQQRVAQLEARARDLEGTISGLEGKKKSVDSELAEAASRLQAERGAVAAMQSDFAVAAAKGAALNEGLLAKEAELEKLDGRRANALAKLAHLEGELGEMTGQGSQNPEEAVRDRLKELDVVPPVLADLKSWKLREKENEADALKRVSDRLGANGLEYHPRVLRAFHTAMKVNDTTQMAILAGISGTGKSQLPRQYAAGMGIGFLQVPVQPRWDSPQDLMGFYNYIEKRYRPTDLARALYQLDVLNNTTSGFDNRMMMVLLDEMNLARVEYYFSDFLSRLESRPHRDQVGDKTLRKDAEIELEIPMPKGRDAPRIFPGYNLLFAGTMNEDESTQSLSDKVVDRANVLRFAAPKKIHSAVAQTSVSESQALSTAQWGRWAREASEVQDEPLVKDGIDRMVRIMQDFHRPFGHRLGRAITAYVANYPVLEAGRDLRQPLADQIEMRLLPKLRGLDVQTYDATFQTLQDYVENGLNDGDLANAIGESVRAAQDGSGQFVWNGVTR